MRNALAVTPRTGQFAGQTIFTNEAHEGIFTRRGDGTLLQHTGTGQTPRFRSTSHLAQWVRRHYGPCDQY